MTFEYYQDIVGEWRWRLVVEGNRKILAVSSESYHNKADMFDAIRKIMTLSHMTPYVEIKNP